MMIFEIWGSHAVFEIWGLSGSQIAAVRSQRVDAALWLAATPLWSSDAEPDALKSKRAGAGPETY